jgi:hypothetical protein
MKKLLMITGLLYAALGFVFAQDFVPSRYEEITLSGFRDWRFNNSGEEKNFQARVLFNSADDIAFVFIDSGLETPVEFETEFPWPPMQSGQPVTIYFNAWGPWVWDRRLDAIDYGAGRLVQAQTGGPSLAAAPPAEASAGVPPAASPSAPVTPPAGSPAPPAGGSPAAPASSATGSPAGPARESGGRADSGVPVTNPSPAEIDSSREDPAFDYGRQPVVTPRQVIVQVSGSPPQRGRYYRLQVGSFAVPANAARAANSLREAGLNPAFEQFQNNVRVVLSHIPGEEVVETARKIGGAGFSTVWCREEP